MMQHFLARRMPAGRLAALRLPCPRCSRLTNRLFAVEGGESGACRNCARPGAAEVLARFLESLP